MPPPKRSEWRRDSDGGRTYSALDADEGAASGSESSGAEDDGPRKTSRRLVPRGARSADGDRGHRIIDRDVAKPESTARKAFVKGARRSQERQQRVSEAGTPAPAPAPKTIFSPGIRGIAQATAAAGRLGDKHGLGDVPKQAFLRLNIFDISEYDLVKKEATVNVYIEISWRCRGLAHHEKVLEQQEAVRRGNRPKEIRWSNTDDDRTNDLPTQVLDFNPLEIVNKGVQSVVENAVGHYSEEQWKVWYTVDPNSEARFNTMGEVLDPTGTDKDICWVSYRGMGELKLKQPVEMRAYPFDSQTVSLIVRHKSEWKLVPNECTNPDGSSYASTFAKDAIETSLEEFACQEKRFSGVHAEMVFVPREAKGRVRPALKAGMRVVRRPEYFYYNYFGPLCLIGTLTVRTSISCAHETATV